jgi:glycosyltransferase involved in cell wall biosynthesis
MRILVLSPVPYEGAGCRFRIAQYVPYLASEGIDVTVAPFYDRELFDIVYRPGHHARKALLFLKQTAARLSTVAGARHYDAVLIYREAFPIGPPVLEMLLRALGRPLVYDFDDAVFLPNTSDANRYLDVLKYPKKVAQILRRCDEVVAGNEYLATYARQFNPSVRVIPTAVDTSVFVPRSAARPPGSRATIGWIGTPTTATYLGVLTSALAAVARTHPFRFRVSGAGTEFVVPGVDVESTPWSLAREVELFNTCDVGVYPLADDDWSRGKCGFKAIEFMACGVPVVAAPIGVNREIIEDGVNGLLASTEDEWAAKLGRLLADPTLRCRLGAAGRRTVEERYSLRVNAPRVAATLRAVVGASRERATR